MHIDELGRRLDDIGEICREIRENPISAKAVPKEEQRDMWKRIEALYDKYEEAIQNDVIYVPNMRKETNSVLHTLRKWLEYDELAFAKLILRLLPYAFDIE